MIVLGIDTSCDDTSAAVVCDGRNIRSNVVSSQTEIHKKYGGIVPELASRRHIEMIWPVVHEAVQKRAFPSMNWMPWRSVKDPDLSDRCSSAAVLQKLSPMRARFPL